jgi:hypothetical protein
MTIARIARIGAAVATAALLSTSAAANAPAGRYMASGGTVYDVKTKLTWQQTVSTTKGYTWADAKTYCSSAAVSSALGGTGWRLPTVKELQSLVDDSQTTGPTIDSQFFSGTPSNVFWSSTPSASASSSAWSVYFSNGVTNAIGVGSTYAVRCVR